MSRAFQAIALTIVLLLAGACSGRIVTQRVSETAINASESKLPGVVIYQPAMLAEVSVMTALVKDGKLVGRATDSPPACTQVPSEKVVMLPDLTRPYVISYEPAIFETNKFGVTLNNGMLAAVNAQPTISTPTLPNILPSGASSLATVANPMAVLVHDPPAPATGRLLHVALHDEPPTCNDGPVVLGHRRLAVP